MVSGLKIRDAIPQQKCIFFNILLSLVSKHESEDRNSRSRLEAWNRREEILDLVSTHETEGKKFSISSRELKLTSRYALGYPPFPLICFPLDFRKSPSAMGGIWFECSKIPVTMATEEDQLFSLCCIRQFLPQMIWMFGIPATMVLTWLVLKLYPLYFFPDETQCTLMYSFKSLQIVYKIVH